MNIPLSSVQTPAAAARVDGLTAIVLLIAAFLIAVVAGMIVFFAADSDRGTDADRLGSAFGGASWELIWAGLPLTLALMLFVRGAQLSIASRVPPSNPPATEALRRRDPSMICAATSPAGHKMMTRRRWFASGERQ